MDDMAPIIYQAAAFPGKVAACTGERKTPVLSGITHIDTLQQAVQFSKVRLSSL